MIFRPPLYPQIEDHTKCIYLIHYDSQRVTTLLTQRLLCLLLNIARHPRGDTSIQSVKHSSTKARRVVYTKFVTFFKIWTFTYDDVCHIGGGGGGGGFILYSGVTVI